jgi:hypothetical protein
VRSQIHTFSRDGAVATPGWQLIHYSPIIVIGTLLALRIGWCVPTKHWFTGPEYVIDLPDDVTSADGQAWRGT